MTTLEDIHSDVQALRAEVAALRAMLASGGGKTKGGGEVADDADLDGQWGDPQVRKDPPRGWDGDSYVGYPFSQCPAEYLDKLAGFLDWAAGKDEQKTDDEKAQKYARFKRKDAARARGWAQRIRSGAHVPTPDAYEDDPPF